jgi:SHS2 domain-containing protein
MGTERGHRVTEHTADVQIEAWGPTLAVCLTEAVAATVEVFAEVSGARPVEARDVELDATGPEQLLVALLEELMVIVDSEGLVPIDVQFAEDHPSRGTLTLVPLSAIEVVGPAPKGVSYGGLEIGVEDRTWRCRAIIDV